MDDTGSRERSAVPFVIASIVAKPIGFLREMLVAAVYGSGTARDAFLVAWQIPGWIGAVISEGLPQTLVPYLAETAAHDRDRRVLGGLLSILAFVFALLGIAMLLAADALVGIVAPFAPATTRVLATSLLEILAFATVLMGTSAVMTAFLYARRRFVLATLAVPAMNIVVMLVVAFAHRSLGIHALAYGTVAGAAAMTLLLLPGLIARPRLPQLVLAPHYRRFFALFAAFVAGTVLFNINALVERMFASTLAVGGMSNLDYGFRLVQMLFALLAILPTYLFPRLCELAVGDDGRPALGALLARGVGATLAVALPLAAFVWATRTPLVATVYQRGAFDDAATRATAELVGWYALGLAAHALNNMVVHGLYAVRALQVRIVYGGLFLVANVGANFALVHRLGAPGLAIANSVAAVACSVYLLTALHRRAPAALSGLLPALWKSAALAAVVAAAAGWVASQVAVPAPWRLVLAALAAALVVWSVARLVRIEGIADLWGALFKARLR